MLAEVQTELAAVDFFSFFTNIKEKVTNALRIDRGHVVGVLNAFRHQRESHTRGVSTFLKKNTLTRKAKSLTAQIQ